MAIDLTIICKLIDSTNGTATYSGTFYDISTAFGGNTCLYICKPSEAMDILRYAASQSNSGGRQYSRARGVCVTFLGR